jgi:N-carbamoyl-L-amino-acid hydrolase
MPRGRAQRHLHRVVSVLPRADAARIATDIEALRALTLPDRPYTRRAFTPVYQEGRRWLARAMAAAGLEVSVDAAGNLIARRPAGPGEPATVLAARGAAAGAVGAVGASESSPASSRRDAPSVAPETCVMIGSHIDTVPDGGAYDGIAGVVAGIEVARLLREAAIALPFALEVADFLAEEPSEFGLSCIGSRGMVGRLSGEDLERREPAGSCLAEAIRDVGGRPETLGSPLREPGSMRAYLELHIEQGRVLERAGVAIGIVTGIVGIRRYQVKITGAAAHSGTTPMDERHDALAGTAELILAVECLAQGYARRGHFVGTVGKLSHTPNASNVIPATATVTIELRALSDVVLDEAELELESQLDALGQSRRLEVSLARVSRTAPVAMDPGLRGALEHAAASAAVETVELPSGGGHDAGHVAALAPAAMIFIPCQDGLSHSPAETASPEHIASGADVLLRTVLQLAKGRDGT